MSARASGDGRCVQDRGECGVSDSQTISHGQRGVEYDVTADVAAFVTGASPNYGWILRKADEGLAGLVSFGTRESTSVGQLIDTYQPSS